MAKTFEHVRVLSLYPFCLFDSFRGQDKAGVFITKKRDIVLILVLDNEVATTNSGDCLRYGYRGRIVSCFADGLTVEFKPASP
jgi:hypothetical protein